MAFSRDAKPEMSKAAASDFHNCVCEGGETESYYDVVSQTNTGSDVENQLSLRNEPI